MYMARYNTNRSTISNKEEQHTNGASISVTLSVVRCAPIPLEGRLCGEDAQIHVKDKLSRPAWGGGAKNRPLLPVVGVTHAIYTPHILCRLSLASSPSQG